VEANRERTAKLVGKEATYLLRNCVGRDDVSENVSGGSKDSSLRDITTIIFDWSGTISDDRRPVYESAMILLKAHGKNCFSFEEWLTTAAISIIEFLAGQGITGERETLFKEYADALSLVRKDGIRPVVYADAKQVLQDLRESGKELMVISSHPEDHLLDEASEYQIKEYLSKIVGSAKDKAQEILRLCSEERIGLQNVIFVGDTAYDIQAAKKAGIRSIGITTGYQGFWLKTLNS